MSVWRMAHVSVRYPWRQNAEWSFKEIGAAWPISNPWSLICIENFLFQSDSLNRTATRNAHGGPKGTCVVECIRMIFVNIGVPDLDMTEHWGALVRRAAANGVLNPAGLNAAA